MVLDVVNESLESWLLDVSRQGSGDDITLGIICRTDILEKKGIPQTIKKAISKKLEHSISQETPTHVHLSPIN